jgi:aminopeptidase N
MKRFLFLSSLLLIAVSSQMAFADLWNFGPPARPERKDLQLHGTYLASAPSESTHSFNVLKYTLDITFAMDTSYIQGVSSILCETRLPDLDTVELNCASLAVDSVMALGRLVTYNLAGENLIVGLDTVLQPYDTFEVDVFYNGYPAQGYYWYSDQPGMPDTTGFSSTEPSDSRYWFPCFDEPWDKADMGCEIIGTVPLDYVVASNGLLTSVDTVGGTSLRYDWVERDPISTYLMCVAITKYAILLDEYISSTGDTIPVQHFVYKEDTAAAAGNFAKVPEMMAYYSSIFGEYPYQKYGMAVVQPFWGGMEHQTMTTMLRWAAVNGWESGIAHELAHQWWGDMVTCFTWPDIWINEGFATYGEDLWVEHEYGFGAYQGNMWSEGYDYFSQDSIQRFPIYDPPPGEIFNWGVEYCKGAWVLHMLRHLMDSDSTFLAIFPDYGQAFRFGNASTADFRGIAEAHYGGSLDWYFNQWIYGQGHPQYNYGWTSTDLGSNSYELDLQIQQIQTNAPAVFEMPVDIEVQTASGDTTIKVWNDQEYQTFTDTLTLASAPTGMSFDPEDWILDEHWEIPFNGALEFTYPARVQMTRMAAAPNPFTSSVAVMLPTGSVNADARLEICDIAGRIVKRLSTDSGHRSNLVWQGLDEHGRPVPAGVYFARVSAGTATQSLKLVKIN